ncbi:MAG: hypothetical protein ACRDQ0_01245, partial [Pseudonocardia sp.]
MVDRVGEDRVRGTGFWFGEVLGRIVGGGRSLGAAGGAGSDRRGRVDQPDRLRGGEPEQGFAARLVGRDDVVADRHVGWFCRLPVHVRAVSYRDCAAGHCRDQFVELMRGQPAAVWVTHVEQVVVTGQRHPAAAGVVAEDHAVTAAAPLDAAVTARALPERGHLVVPVLVFVLALVVAFYQRFPVDRGHHVAVGQDRVEEADRAEIVRVGSEQHVEPVDRLGFHLHGLGQCALPKPPDRVR